MDQEIPKIIHQIWSGIEEPLPDHFKELGNTWKEHHPTWEYQLWDNNKINSFIKEYYPQYWTIYTNFPYNVQRWDAMRYLILDKIGGMYVDFDYEALESIEKLIRGKTCCFALEPERQYQYFNKNLMFNNALMLSIPDSPFMKNIIETVFTKKNLEYPHHPKKDCVLNTTGPFILIDLYEKLTTEQKQDIYLIPAKHVTPFDGHQAKLFRMGIRNDTLEDCLQDAYAVHYFFNGWLVNND